MVRDDGCANNASHGGVLLHVIWVGSAVAETCAERLFGQHHILDIAEELEAPVPALAAHTAALDAAKRRSQIADAKAVDPDEAGAHLLRHGARMLHLAVADATQAVVRAVGQGDSVFVAVKDLQGEYRSEDLVLHDLAVLAHPSQQRGLVILRTEGMVRATP